MNFKEIPNICIVCLKELVSAIKDDDYYIPDGGIICRTYGNYGSEIFDYGLHESNIITYLTFLICDSCLLARSKFINQVVETKPESIVEWKNFHEIRKEYEIE